MHFKKIVVLTVFIPFLYSVAHTQTDIIGPQIIPIPQKQLNTSGNFTLNSSTGIQFENDFKVSADFLKSYIEIGSGIQLENNNSIQFIKDKSILNPEGYKLEINPKHIKISASSDKGAFYAVQTLRQLLPESFENSTFPEKSATIQSQTIEDAPQFSYRGMHLDVTRHFFSVEFIKKYIDAIAMLKMNTFHWHLTDDQGWRIEIKKYPKLQEVAAYRKETLVGHYNSDPQQFDGKKYGGFYTQEQIMDVVAYAQTRHVTIIPEIEMPGHAQAAISAYPELGCTGEQIDVATKWGVFEDIFCPKESTFEFLENVLDEVLELFPSEYIHIGGDEAPKTRWKECKHCQSLIQKKGLKGEHELQSYFIKRIENYLNNKGRQIIGWDEILEGGLAPNATVMSWRGMEGAIQATKQQHNVIMTPTSHCYFDYYQSDNDNEPLAIGGFLPLEKVYNFNPIPKELNKEESKYILGAQGNLWTEYIPDEKQVEYMVFPRMIAMSEVVWSNPKKKSYEDFISRLEHFHKRLGALNINYANHLYEVDGDLTTEGYALTTLTKDKNIRFTLDGSEPTLNSDIYSKPIQIEKNTFIKATIFNTEKKLGTTFSQAINTHKAFGKKIILNVEPNKTYSGSGTEGLINGISGSDTRYGDKQWLGFWGDDVEITIDLGEEMEINSIETRFYNAPGQWIYAPETIEFIVSDDKMKIVKPIITISPRMDENSALKIFQEDFTENDYKYFRKKVRYIYLTIPNYGTIPEGKQGAGHKAWTFIDEIIIK